MLSLEQKKSISEEIKIMIKSNSYLYLVNISDLNAVQSHDLRAICFNKQVGLRVVKNKVFLKVIESLVAESNGSGHPLEDIVEKGILKENTALMISPQASTAAKLIKDFRKDNEKPLVKVAFIDGDLYYGDDLESLIAVKSKEELIADLASIVNAPIASVMGAVSSAGAKITACLQAITEKKEKG